jgi:CheY-like chemotaxis protein
MNETNIPELRVLVVEDEALIAMLVEDMLLGLGCTMLGPAADTVAALSMVQELEYDVAILDVNLGGERTTPVAEELHARGVPFIFATGYGASGIDARFKDRPVLTKPFRDADLASALRALV